jgi:redox-sensitive bicupin YhaK (pirin superfamily)
MDNAMFYCFKGAGTLNGTPFKAQQICRFDTSGGSVKAAVSAGAAGLRMMVFTGKMTKEDVVWHGPFVCADRAQLRECFKNQQLGRFPPVRVPYNYKDVTQVPK